MFGIEIRRKGNVTSLYSDVSTVLQKAGIQGEVISKDFKRTSIAHSVQKMISGNYFSVCTVDECAKVAGLVIPQERKNIYNTQHCINWSEMLPEHRQVLIAMILDDFKPVLNPDVEHEITPLARQDS